mgnify:FL=1
MGESASAKIVKPYLETSLVKRIDWIDFLKAFAIFLVVWGHIIQSNFPNLNTTNGFILAFHMPLFAILSGLFFNADSGGGKLVRHKFRALILPLIVWSFIVGIGFRGIRETYMHFAEGYTIHFKSWAEGLLMYIVSWGWWFLRVLFLCFIYAYFSIRICKRNMVMGIALSILLLYSLSLSGIIPNKIQHDFIFLYPFFCVGILIKTYHSFIDNHTIAILLLSATVFLICLHFWHGYEDTFYSMNTSMKAPTGYKDITGIKVLYKTLFRILTGASGSIAFILLAKVFQSVLTNRQILNIGKNTLAIYLSHSIIIDASKGFAPLLPASGYALSLVVSIAASLIIIAFCYWFAKITSKSQWLNFLLWGKAMP